LTSTGALEQFEGATIEKIGITRGGHERLPLFYFWMTLRLKDGSTRDLRAYTTSVLHFRVDGQYVAPEELPGHEPPPPVAAAEPSAPPRPRNIRGPFGSILLVCEDEDERGKR